MLIKISYDCSNLEYVCVDFKITKHLYKVIFEQLKYVHCATTIATAWTNTKRLSLIS